METNGIFLYSYTNLGIVKRSLDKTKRIQIQLRYNVSCYWQLVVYINICVVHKCQNKINKSKIMYICCVFNRLPSIYHINQSEIKHNLD